MTHVLQCPHCYVGPFSAVSNANTSVIISSVFAGCQIPYPKREFLNEDEPEEKTEKVILFSYSWCMEHIVDVVRCVSTTVTAGSYYGTRTLVCVATVGTSLNVHL